MRRHLRGLVVLTSLGLCLSCGAAPRGEHPPGGRGSCGDENVDPSPIPVRDVPTLANGETWLGGKRCVLPMVIESYQDKIGLWCSGPVDLCFGMRDRDGGHFEICETRDTRTDEPWVLYSPQVEEKSEENRGLLLAVLQNAVASRLDPEEIQRIKDGSPCLGECGDEYWRYVDALAFLRRWTR